MRRLLPLFLLAGPLVRGAEVVVMEPFQTGLNYTLDASFTNNDNGANYDSAEVRLWQELGVRVFALGNSAQADVAGMMNSEWSITVKNTSPGEVFAGWSADAQIDGMITMEHAPFGFTTWQNTASNPAQDTLAIRIGINNGLLEVNGVPGYQPFTLSDVQAASWDPGQWDAIIVRSDSPLLGQRNLTRARPPLSLAAAFVGMEGIFSYSASSLSYELLVPGDFAGWTDFASEHPSLDPAADANHNGRSNFLDYASGQDPEASGLLAPVELHGTTLTLRQRINGLDAAPVAEYSDDLGDWFPLEEGVHYSVRSESVAGVMRTWVLDLLSVPPTRFFRQRFGP